MRKWFKTLWFVILVASLVFVALVVMSIVSIVGRKLLSWPVPGDVEVLQMCAAFASSSFFAYCHLINGDVPHPLPVILGHEAAGVVERVGPGVESVTVR